MDRARITDIASLDAAGRPAVATTEISDERVRTSLFSILNENRLCSIATVTSDHRAHINSAYFCFSDDLELFFLSHPGSLHCRNLATNPSMAMSVFSSRQQWGGSDQGAQIFGTCAEAGGEQAQRAEELYGRRFPAYVNWKASLGEDHPARGYRFYLFEADEVKMLDEREFGEGLFVRARIERARGR